MEALLPGASGQLMEDEGDVKTLLQKSVLEGLDCNSGVVALKSLRVELFWKSCFGKQLAAPEAMGVQMSGNRCVCQQHEKELVLQGLLDLFRAVAE